MAETALGRNIKLLIERNHWQQSDLARTCRLSEATVSRIISGDQPNPTARTLQALAGAFRCPVSQLLADEPEPREASEATEAVLLELYRLLPPDERAKIVEYAEAIALKRERDRSLAGNPGVARRQTGRSPVPGAAPADGRA